MDHLSAAVHTAEDLRVGLSAEFEREITEADVLAFAGNSGDFNPLHVDSQYAQNTELGARVVHGAYQVALASCMLGMYLPGRNSLLVSCSAQFQQPLRFPCRVAVRGDITAWDAQSLRGNLKVGIVELPSGITQSVINMGFTCHDRAPLAASAPRRSSVRPSVGRKTILITGASGGIGSELVAEFADEYAVAAVVNRHALPTRLVENPCVFELSADLSDAASTAHLEERIADKSLYGIVHAAWPGMERGGLLSVSSRVLEQQLAFATSRTIELARLLVNKGTGEGGRLVVLGSLAGTQKPALGTAAYSLAKAALEQTVKLLAPELALKQITVNAVCPSLVPVGMNRLANDRQKLLAKAAVPLGRLCETADVVGAVRYLFSPQASFVSGQTIVLSGGQL